MALISCPQCGKEISDKAEKCVKCGYKLNKQNTNGKKIIRRFLIIFIIITIYNCYGNILENKAIECIKNNDYETAVNICNNQRIFLLFVGEDINIALANSIDKCYKRNNKIDIINYSNETWKNIDRLYNATLSIRVGEKREENIQKLEKLKEYRDDFNAYKWYIGSSYLEWRGIEENTEISTTGNVSTLESLKNYSFAEFNSNSKIKELETARDNYVAALELFYSYIRNNNYMMIDNQKNIVLECMSNMTNSEISIIIVCDEINTLLEEIDM